MYLPRKKEKRESKAVNETCGLIKNFEYKGFLYYLNSFKYLHAEEIQIGYYRCRFYKRLSCKCSLIVEKDISNVGLDLKVSTGKCTEYTFNTRLKTALPETAILDVEPEAKRLTLTEELSVSQCAKPVVQLTTEILEIIQTKYVGFEIP
jgi:hypothetical protein